MPAAARSMVEHSRELLACLASSEALEALPVLLDRREALIQELGAALAAGRRVSEAEAQEIRQLEEALRAAFAERRERICAEMEALRRGGEAASAYQADQPRTPIYLDGAG